MRQRSFRATAFETLSTFAKGIGGAFTSLARDSIKRLSLVPYYLSHLLWLLEATFLDLARKGYGGNPAVYACIRLLCQSIPEPPLVPHTLGTDGKIGDALDWQHPLRRLIRRPNAFMTEFQFWKMTTLHINIVGRALWWKERDNIGRIIALWPLRPDRVGPIYARDDDPNPVLLGWSYLIPGSTQYLGIPANDVAMFLLPDPAGESGGLVEGLGPLQVLAAEISADNKATEFVSTLVGNYAMPGLVLEVPGTISDKNTAVELKEAFMEDFGGTRRGEPMIADRGSKVTQVGFSLKDLEFPGLRKISESRVAAVFGVPAILVGLLVGLESGIKATTDELRALFAETTCAAYWSEYAEAYTHHVANEFDENVICEFDLTKVRALAGQALAQVDRIASAYQDGAILIDEYREALDFDPLPNGEGQVLATGIGQGRGMETYLLPGQTAQPTAPVPATNSDTPNDPVTPGQPATPTRAAPVSNPDITALADPARAGDVGVGHQLAVSIFDGIMRDLEAANG